MSGSASSSATPATPTQSEAAPSTPAQPAPATPLLPPDQQPKKKQKVAKEQPPLTSLQKGRDMAGKLLKKKSEASTLSLTLQTQPYAAPLSAEMFKFAQEFEQIGCKEF